jgi:hypothetical protein
MIHVLHDGVDIAERNQQKRSSIVYRLMFAWVAVEAGQMQVAEQLCAGSIADAKALKSRFCEALAGILQGRIALAHDRADDALRELQAVASLFEGERVLMDWILEMPLRMALAQSHLARGDIPQARSNADRFHAIAFAANELTYRALAAATSAHVALREADTTRALSDSTVAVDIVKSANLPLAEPFVYAVAAAVAQARQDASQEEECRAKSAAIKGRLALEWQGTESRRCAITELF